MQTQQIYNRASTKHQLRFKHDYGRFAPEWKGAQSNPEKLRCDPDARWRIHEETTARDTDVAVVDVVVACLSLVAVFADCWSSHDVLRCICLVFVKHQCLAARLLLPSSALSLSSSVVVVVVVVVLTVCFLFLSPRCNRFSLLCFVLLSYLWCLFACCFYTVFFVMLLTFL